MSLTYGKFQPISLKKSTQFDECPFEDVTDTDVVPYMDHVLGKLLHKEHLAEQTRHNTKEHLALGSVEKDLIDTVIEAWDRNQALTNQILGNERVRRRFAGVARDLVYDRFTRLRTPPPGFPLTTGDSA